MAKEATLQPPLLLVLHHVDHTPHRFILGENLILIADTPTQVMGPVSIAIGNRYFGYRWSMGSQPSLLLGTTPLAAPLPASSTTPKVVVFWCKSMPTCFIGRFSFCIFPSLRLFIASGETTTFIVFGTRSNTENR